MNEFVWCSIELSPAIGPEPVPSRAVVVYAELLGLHVDVIGTICMHKMCDRCDPQAQHTLPHVGGNTQVLRRGNIKDHHCRKRVR